MKTKTEYHIENPPNGCVWSGSLIVDWSAEMIIARKIEYDVNAIDCRIIIQAETGEQKALDLSDYHVSIMADEHAVCQPEEVTIDMKKKTVLVDFWEVEL